MKFFAVVAAAAVAATGVEASDSAPTLDIGKIIKDNFDRPLPEAGRKYVIQGVPLAKMMIGKMESKDCKTNWNKFFDKLVDDARGSAAITPRSFTKEFCELGDSCVTEALEVGKGFIEKNNFAKGIANKFLTENGLELDTIIMGAPLMYYGLCDSLEAAEENGMLGDGKDEL